MVRRVVGLEPVGVADYDWAVLKSVLRLCEGRLRDEWKPVAGIEPGVVVIDPSTIAGQAILASNVASRPVVALLNNGADVGTDILALRRPFRPQAVVETFNAASQRLADLPFAIESRKAGATVEGDADQCLSLAEALRTVCGHWRRRGVWTLHGAEAGTLTIDCGLDRVIGSLRDAPSLLVDKDYRVLLLHDEAANLQGADQAGSFADLIWNLGRLVAGEGRLFPVGPNTRWRLDGWPHFGPASTRHHNLRVAAVLHEQTASLEELECRTGVDRPVIEEILNAAWLSGCLVEVSPGSEVAREETTRPASLSERVDELFCRLRHRWSPR